MPPSMDGPSITADELAGLMREGLPLRILDVRRQPAFEKDPRTIAGAERVLPDRIQEWMGRHDKSIRVVAYCVHGHEVSQGAVASLRGSGFDASFLHGGISQWQDQGLATAASDA